MIDEWTLIQHHHLPPQLICIYLKAAFGSGAVEVRMACIPSGCSEICYVPNVVLVPTAKVGATSGCVRWMMDAAC